VSVVIDLMMPFFGDPGLLRDAVHSVLAQSSDDWRLTVVDDCYPDADAAAWVSALGHPNVTYVRNDERLGVGANFRRCLALASAPYVTFMGCDDLLDAEYVAIVSDAVRSHGAVAAVQPGVRVIDEDGTPSRGLTDRVKRRLAPRSAEIQVLFGEELATSLLHGNWAYFPSICWRTEFVKAHSFREDMETVLDFDLLLDLVLEGQELLLVPQDVFSYRRHRRSASSATARSTARFEEESRLFAETARRCADRGWDRATRAARTHLTSRLHAAILVPGALARRDRASARRLVRHAIERPLY
jgi:glycosyltransferase involved in cell wall biosynthesis